MVVVGIDRVLKLVIYLVGVWKWEMKAANSFQTKSSLFSARVQDWIWLAGWDMGAWIWRSGVLYYICLSSCLRRLFMALAHLNG